MSGDWKSGDVAMVTIDGKERPAIRSQDGGRWIAEPEPTSSRRVAESARPLVVIDPEDREQVERLVRACPDDWAFTSDEETLREVMDHMQAALRRFVTPPKPEEPTGLGAVVEDAKGDLWVRRTVDPHWNHANAEAFPVRWNNLTAVRVLSEGVAS